MSQDAVLRCRCGEVHGRLANASPQTVSRIVCYCDDCQAALHHLGRADLLDAHGGSDIVQVAPASLTFDRGAERIVGLRLTPKGVYRWHSSCCNTPLGNTLTPAVPFVGVLASVFERDGQRADGIFGKPAAAIQGKFAVGVAPEGSTKRDLRVLARAIVAVLGWRLRGKTWPHPFFDRATRAPKYPITTLSREARDALRPLCGPQATVLAGR